MILIGTQFVTNIELGIQIRCANVHKVFKALGASIDTGSAGNRIQFRFACKSVCERKSQQKRQNGMLSVVPQQVSQQTIQPTTQPTKQPQEACRYVLHSDLRAIQWLRGVVGRQKRKGSHHGTFRCLIHRPASAGRRHVYRYIGIGTQQLIGAGAVKGHLIQNVAEFILGKARFHVAAVKGDGDDLTRGQDGG